MKFYESRVYTALNAGKLKKGDKVIVADTIKELRDKVEADGTIYSIESIEDEDTKERFCICNGFNVIYSLAYLIETAPEKKWRAYKDLQELFMDRKINTDYPLLWIKTKIDNKSYHNITRLITMYDLTSNKVFANANYTLDELFENFIFTDGSPCGIEE